MKRRQLLLTGPAAIAWMAVRPAFPQQSTSRPRRIGGLFAQAQSDPAEKRFWAAFLEGLREYGWVEGQNLIIEGRWVEGQPERYAAYAAELVSRGDIEVIVAVGTQATRETKMRTTTIPIVMVYTYDPVTLRRIAILLNPNNPVIGPILQEMKLTAETLMVDLQQFEARPSRASSPRRRYGRAPRASAHDPAADCASSPA
jgi:putative tryptophan/tyrosine transport system substrate-binding protein